MRGVSAGRALVRGGVLLAALAGCAAHEPPSTAARARALLGASEAPRGNVVLRCGPRDAEVLLDGVMQGLCSDFAPLSAGLSVGEGLHAIEVRRDGYWPYTTYVEPHNARATLRAELRPMAARAAGAEESK